MDLITVDEMDALPDDPIAAFVHLERLCRSRLNEQINNSDDRWDPTPAKQEYMTVVTAAAQAFGVPGVTEYTSSDYNDADFNFHYREAISAATKLGVTLKLRRAAETVALPDGSKARLRKHVASLREILESTTGDISEKRRKILTIRLEAFSNEIDKARSSIATMLGAAAAVAATLTSVGVAEGDIAKLPETVHAISVLIGREKVTEDETTPNPLPLPAPPKRLSAPSKHSSRPSSAFDSDLDDDVPF